MALIKQKFDARFRQCKQDAVFHLNFKEDDNGLLLLREFLMSGDLLVDNLSLAVDQVASLLVSKAKNAGLHNKTLSDADRQEKSRGVLGSSLLPLRSSAWLPRLRTLLPFRATTSTCAASWAQCGSGLTGCRGGRISRRGRLPRRQEQS